MSREGRLRNSGDLSCGRGNNIWGSRNSDEGRPGGMKLQRRKKDEAGIGLPGSGSDPSAYHFWHSSSYGLKPGSPLPWPPHAELHTQLHPFRSKGLGGPNSIVRDWAHTQRKGSAEWRKICRKAARSTATFKDQVYLSLQGSELFSTQYLRL